MVSRFSSIISLLLVALSLGETIAVIPTPIIAIHKECGIESESLQALVSLHLHKTSNYTGLEGSLAPEAFQFLKLDFDNFSDQFALERNKAVLKFLNQPSASYLRAGVKEFDVSYHATLDSLYPEIEKLLQSLDNIKIIRWKLEEPISATTLRHLERNNPDAQIYYTVPFNRCRDCVSRRGWYPLFDKETNCSGPTPFELATLQSIINSTNLYSLKAHLEHGIFTNRDSLRLIFKALSTCPNIRELDLSIAKGQSLYMTGNGQPDYFDFRSNPDTKFPALEVLKLRGYNLGSTSNAEWDELQLEDFGDEEGDAESSRPVWISSQQQRFHVATERSNIEEWLQAMDWSKLHTLHLEQPYAAALQALKDAVTKLKHIEFVGGNPQDGSASVDFVINTQLPLETLSLSALKLRSFDKLVDGIIERHGGSMKSLKINARHVSRNTRLILSNTAVSRLLYACENLETFDIDMASTSDWDYPLLKELARHPRLRSLTLRAEPERNKAQPLNDYLFPSSQTLFNGTSAAGLFRYLRRQTIGQPLEKLDLLVFPSDGGAVGYKQMGLNDFVLRYRCSVDAAGVESCTEAVVRPSLV